MSKTKAQKDAAKLKKEQDKLAADAASQGSSSEQGQDLAGNQPGETSGSDHPGSAEENQSADNSPKDSESDAKNEGEKVFKISGNLSFNGEEFHAGQAIHESDKNFKDLKALGFLN